VDKVFNIFSNNFWDFNRC